MLKYGVPKALCLANPFIYINDLNHTTKDCKKHHFADDTHTCHILAAQSWHETSIWLAKCQQYLSECTED